MLLAIEQRHRQHRFDAQRVNPLFDRGQLRCILDALDGHWPLVDRQSLQSPDEPHNGHDIRLFYPGRAVLQRR